MLYRQHIENDLGFKGVDSIYWGPASFRPQSFNAGPAKQIINDKPSRQLLTSTEPFQSPCDDSKPSVSFLSLPLEIRLMIYGYVHNMKPIQFTKLMDPSEVSRISPWYPRMPLKECVYKRVTPKASEEPPKTTHDPSSPLLSPYRPFAGFQSSLLRANKQIYHDCRTYPFRENEFIFFTWFSSGLWAAHSFMKRLQPWQRDSTRFVRLELMSSDLQGACDAQWEEVCGFFARGLRGLRLKILGVVAAARSSSVVAEVVGGLKQSRPTVEIWDSEGRVVPWIQRGLKCMRSLEQLEVELLVPDWDDKRKLEWCRCLEGTLNDPVDNRDIAVRVTCVEKAEG